MKKIIIVGLVVALMLSITGCTISQAITDGKTSNGTELEGNKQSNNGDTETTEKFYVSTTDDVQVGESIMVGEIIEFDENYIHIISGDLIEIFEYNGDNDNFYLGQEVKLVKGKNANYLEAIEKDNYTITHTNMGEMIDRIKGDVVNFKNDKFTIESGNKKVNFLNFNDNFFLNVGESVEVYTIKSYDSEEYYPIMVLQQDQVLELTITELTKDREGNLISLLKNQNDETYTINLSKAMVEFNIADLKVGDKLNVYYNSIMESDPMQLDVVLIRK